MVLALLPFSKLLVDGSDLLFDINMGWRLREDLMLRYYFRGWGYCEAFPPCGLLLRDRVSKYRVENICPLTGKALEIVGDVSSGKIRRSKSLICFSFLFLPIRIEKFNYKG